MKLLRSLKKKKKTVITKKEHDAWHKKNGYENKTNKEHEACHRKYGIVVKKVKS